MAYDLKIDSIDMKEDSVDMEDELKMTILIREMTVSIWDIVSL
jgi:hypothetical protein